MQPLFAVIRRHGGAWKMGRPLEEQEAWEAHARFMDALHLEGVVVLAGPLGDSEALLIVRAETPAQVEQRLASDPWTKLNLLLTTRTEPWILRIGSLA
jgi:uncharacterized protein YciI